MKGLKLLDYATTCWTGARTASQSWRCCRAAGENLSLQKRYALGAGRPRNHGASGVPAGGYFRMNGLGIKG